MVLYGHQKKALEKMHNGCILCGGVGSGKSLTALAYYYLNFDGDPGFLDGGEYKMMKDPKNLYIITTARKRDCFEWDDECRAFYLQPGFIPYEDLSVVIDSWNNIQKYKTVKDAFFIFDEQRVTGTGAWVRAFLKIAKVNEWILLSATPGDNWNDYGPVFVANDFYKDITDFRERHIIYNRWNKWKIDKYVHEGKLEYYRRKVLVNMSFERETNRHYLYLKCDYDKEKYKLIQKERWNPWKEEPYVNAAGLCYGLRRCVNSDLSRIDKLCDILEERWKAIIFYNYDYELEILKNLLDEIGIVYRQWNGHIHEDIPDWDRWAYLVNYSSGSEGWNCTACDTIIFFSQNYSYKVFEQASGRIDRLNTPFKDLYYYVLLSNSPIDMAIKRCVDGKKKFNESSFIGVKGIFE